jgi:hypothetical protein
MFIDHKKIFAAASAIFGVRSGMGKAFLIGCLAGAGLVQAADGPEGAPHREQAPHRQFDQRQFDQRQPQSGGDQQGRQLDPRSYEARAEEQRRAMQEAGHNAEVSRRMGRMTPDERRDLRRQINEVGQDLYANPPRR